MNTQQTNIRHAAESSQTNASGGPVEFDKRDRNRDGIVDQDELIDFESEQSFPASDSPSWTLGTT